MNKVKATATSVVILTYKPCTAAKGTLFIEKLAYPGSWGKVYPMAVTEKISEQKEDVSSKALVLENDYLYMMILSEIRGEIYRAYDKTNEYDFMYFNHVIKPVWVGLIGLWASGTIEFNWPQHHHRPSTFLSADYHYMENEVGSCLLYVGEIDRRYGTQGMTKISLYPNKDYIEIDVQLYNLPDIPQSFLWRANPTVPLNDDTILSFPRRTRGYRPRKESYFCFLHCHGRILQIRLFGRAIFLAMRTSKCLLLYGDALRFHRKLR